MSFSGMVKEELFERVGNARHCNLAELAAILMKKMLYIIEKNI